MSKSKSTQTARRIAHQNSRFNASRLKSLFSQRIHSTEEKQQILQDAITNVSSDPISINLYLKLCLHHKLPDHALLIWNDIQNPSHSDGIVYPLLFKCCIESRSISDGISVLETMMRIQYNFRDAKEEKEHSMNITKLIRMCGTATTADIKSLRHIRTVLVSNHNLFIKTEFIRQFARQNLLDESLEVFYSISDDQKDIVIITTMMRALINSHRYRHALELYTKYENLNDAVSHMLALEACTLCDDSEHFEIGKRIHLQIPKEQMTIKLKSTLIDFYGHFGDTQSAMNIFDSITEHQKDSISVNGMMTQLNRNEKYTECITLYERYQSLNNAVSHLVALKACTNLGDFEQCKLIEKRMNIRNHDIISKTAVIDFYAHFGDIISAQKVFESMNLNPNDPKSIESVNAMMTGYLRNEHYESALKMYDRYQLIHDDVSHLLALKACIHTNDSRRGNVIYRKLSESKDWKTRSNALQNTLIEYFGHFGDTQSAKRFFDSMERERTVTEVTIVVIMKALISNGYNEEALTVYDGFERLQSEAAHLLAIKSCVNMENYQKGRDIHLQLIGHEMNCLNPLSEHMKTALLEFYGHYGDIESSFELFSGMNREKMDIVPYNAMMNAYSKNGELEKVKALFVDMKQRGTEMSGRTYIALINACSHSGRTDQARRVWEEEISDENIKYDEYVVTSIVDCFARKGDLKEARNIILEFEARTQNHNQVMWMSLMSGCRNHGDRMMLNTVYQDIRDRFTRDTQYLRSVSLLYSRKET